MLTIADLIAQQNTKEIDAVDFSYVKGQIASPSAKSIAFFGEELLTGLRQSEGYLQAQTLLSLLKSANNLTDFNYVYYCLRNKPALKLFIERLRPDRYRLNVQSQVDSWSDDWFFFFKDDGQQFDPQAVKEFGDFK
jgi:hypothetical protein